VALLATLIPARRAARVSPMSALNDWYRFGYGFGSKPFSELPWSGYCRTHRIPRTAHPTSGPLMNGPGKPMRPGAVPFN